MNTLNSLSTSCKSCFEQPFIREEISEERKSLLTTSVHTILEIKSLACTLTGLRNNAIKSDHTQKTKHPAASH